MADARGRRMFQCVSATPTNPLIERPLQGHRKSPLSGLGGSRDAVIVFILERRRWSVKKSSPLARFMTVPPVDTNVIKDAKPRDVGTLRSDNFWQTKDDEAAAYLFRFYLCPSSTPVCHRYDTLAMNATNLPCRYRFYIRNSDTCG